MQKQQGFTLIELMIVVAIVGILAAIAIPQYQNYTQRARMTEAVTAASAAKTAVAETYQTTGTLPADNQAAGLDNTPGNITSEFVESVTVTSGVIAVAVQGTGNTDLNDATLTFTPQTNAGAAITTGYNGPIEWACTVNDASVAQFFPANCRGTTAD
ncbi:pilin family protein [Salinisphaera dokdonensis CL-ES53]|uniref:Pilin family protein n=1 Tax=Salinisphaera dokdonensis CL-ES53 TaxID=1304272 RepID=A0ABV2AX57_9GAMM